MSNDACFMGMPSRVGPVAILGLWAAMVGAAIVGPLVAGKSGVLVSSGLGRSNWRCWTLKIVLLSRGNAPDHRRGFAGKRKVTVPDVTETKIGGTKMHGRVRLR